MVKQVLCSLALVAGLMALLGGSVAAQELPKAAISDYFLVRPSPPVMSEDFPKPQDSPARVPDYCKPCLFYGGDFDPSNVNANGLWNGVSVVSGEVLVPFTVGRGETWLVTGLFTNNLSNVSVIDPQKANWSISKGVTTGSGGYTIASGTARATYTPTGRSGFGYTEYTVLVHTPTVIVLRPGTYWLTVVPLCTNSADSLCGGALYYESNTEDSPPLDHYGLLEPNDLSYFNSADFGDTYAPTWGPSGACGGVGCDRFSAGVLGL
jgi:hypothetical protein